MHRLTEPVTRASWAVCEIDILSSGGPRFGKGGQCLCQLPKASSHLVNARASFGAQLKCHLLSGALQYPLCPSHMLGTLFLAGPTIVKYKLNIYPMTRNCVVICLISLSCWPAGSKWADLHLDYHCCVSHTYGSGFMHICGKNMCLKACMMEGVDMGD